MTAASTALSRATVELRTRWFEESAIGGWVFASDWHNPAVDAVCEACLKGENVWASAERLGAVRAAAGASLGETLADVDGLAAVFPDLATDLLCRAVSLGWADRMSVSAVTVRDPLTGLVSLGYLQTRMGEVYAAADVTGCRVSTGHALVVVRLDLGGRNGWDRLTPLILAGDALRTVFDGGQTLAKLSDQMAVALTERDARIARRAQLLAGMVGDRLLRDGHSHRARPRVWIEKLPDSVTAAVDLIGELGR